MCIAGFRQPIELDLGSSYRPRPEQLGDPIEMPPGASHGRPEGLYVVAIRLRRFCARRDEGRAAAWLEDREGALGNVAADGIEHGIAIGHELGEITGVVVDDFIRADVTQIGMVGQTRRRDDMGADMLGKLDGEAGDPACAALDQDRLPRLQLQRILDRTHGRQAGERQGGGIDMR